MSRIAGSKTREFNAKAQRCEDKTISTTKNTKKHESGTVFTTEGTENSLLHHEGMKLMKVIHVSLHERGHDRIHAMTRFSLSVLRGKNYIPILSILFIPVKTMPVRRPALAALEMIRKL